MLSSFHNKNTYQPDLFDVAEPRKKSKQLMAVLDKINQKGLGNVFLASQGI